jgi:hypothetical protein
MPSSDPGKRHRHRAPCLALGTMHRYVRYAAYLGLYDLHRVARVLRLAYRPSSVVQET